MRVELEESVWRTGPRFPLRLAALDVGSNAIRYSVAEFSDVAHFVELETQRFPVRLGHDAFTTGTLGSAILDAAVAAAVRFRQRLDDLGVKQYRAAATSAVRESRNGGELVERVRRESGIHLETITGGEEARLVWMAVRNRVELDGDRWLLVDLGGGSIELTVIEEGGVVASESHPMGTVRLLEELAPQADDQMGFLHLLERFAGRLGLPSAPPRPIAGVLLTGGNAEALADLLAGPSPVPGSRKFDTIELLAMRDRLATMTVQERIAQLGLREDRADVILPATVVFARVAEISSAQTLIVPGVGVKDGLLYDLAIDFVEHRSHEGELDRLALSGSIALGRRYRFDEAHALHVRDLALSLFDQLEDLHELEEVSRRRLSCAALLHDIGQFVSYRKHHKHSWYMLSNSEIPGLSPDDVEIVALVTRYHRRSEPKDDHEGYGTLSNAQRAEVRKLASLLRIADALDREHQGHVRRITIERRGSKAAMKLDTTGDTALEQWALKKKSALFERVFDLKIVLE